MSIDIDALVKAIEQAKGEAVVVFQNSLANSRFALKNGKECIFQQGKFATGIVEEIKELAEEVNAGNPHIYIDQDLAKVLVNKAELDPMEAFRRRIIAEHEAQKAKIEAGDADYGDSQQGKLNAANSTSIAAAASGSISGAATAGTAKIVAGPR